MDKDEQINTLARQLEASKEETIRQHSLYQDAFYKVEQLERQLAEVHAVIDAKCRLDNQRVEAATQASHELREAQQRIESLRDERRLPVRDVVRAEIGRRWPAIARRKIFEQLDTRTFCRAKRGDPEPGAEHVVQMFLFDVVVFALTGDLHAKRVPIKAQRCVGVVDDDCGVVDPEKHVLRCLMPFR